MKHLLLGAGIFGKSLALRLIELGDEVFIVDHNEAALESVKDMVTSALVAESTNRDTLNEIVEKFSPDDVVVCFGESFDATMMSVIYLKDLGVSRIYARASNYMQGEILNRLGVNSVILPEAMMGQRFADSLVLGENEQLILDSENTIARVKIPQNVVGKKLSELEVEKSGIKVLFVHREYIAHKVSKTISPQENPQLDEGDNLVVLGATRRIAKFINRLNKKF
ncbi:hypothetical protein DRQ26_01900 [bacterium]|nr:MAG: hypothetical protein DRQ26_01900 [bacterium]